MLYFSKRFGVRVSPVTLSAPLPLTDVLVSLDVLQHRPLLVVPVVSSLSIGLELLHSGGGSSTGADAVHRGGHPLSDTRLHGPHLPKDLEQDRLHALVHADVRHGGGGAEEERTRLSDTRSQGGGPGLTVN
uniref:Uncharacterized protein n=1 Tax=Oryzias sinensis TaxID=183150 RepID=A0A8C7X8T0_9TELE